MTHITTSNAEPATLTETELFSNFLTLIRPETDMHTVRDYFAGGHEAEGLDDFMYATVGDVAEGRDGNDVAEALFRASSELSGAAMNLERLSQAFTKFKGGFAVHAEDDDDGERRYVIPDYLIPDSVEVQAA